jgi:hypothetical protein
MKPHLRRYKSLWYCAEFAIGRVGMGYTALSAYADWAAMRKNEATFTPVQKSLVLLCFRNWSCWHGYTALSAYADWAAMRMKDAHEGSV